MNDRFNIAIDGYNVIHKVETWAEAARTSIERARDLLLAYCVTWKRQNSGAEVVAVVFDGDSSVASLPVTPGPGLRVEFTPSGKTADDRIVEIVRGWRNLPARVVTDDNELRGRCIMEGGSIIPVETFYKPLRIHRHMHGDAQPAAEPDLTTSEIDDINRELRRVWNIED